MANVIITGASRGIGFELVRLFARDGHEVLAISRNTASLDSLNNPLITTFSLDLAETEAGTHLSEHLKRKVRPVDILINNAGNLLRKPFLETSAEEFEMVYRVNVFGLAAVTRAVIPSMPVNGHVVSISSMGGVQGSAKFPGLSAYSSSKAAVITLTELWAEEFKDSGPFFNVLALGAVETEMLAEAFPGYKAPVSAGKMAAYIMDFALNGHSFYNGKLLPVSSTTP